MSDLAVPAPLIEPATAADPFLESKFEIPERPRFMVTRPRLLHALSDRTEVPITLIVGPAGSGKTQLAASWASGSAVDAAVAWVTLEDKDQTCTFWNYVVEALRRAGVPMTGSLPLPPSGDTVDRSFLVRLATDLSDQPRSVLLVLDGVSDLSGRQWAIDLEFVLRHASPMLRLVLVGRWDPPLPLHRYRLADRLTEVRSESLAFTSDEAAELLRLHGVDLSPAGLSSLLEHTEGWAAGLRLFAMALQDHRDADRLVNTITGNEATIAEYFVDEVLRVQPPHVRTFLLETSILDTFTPELAEAVTGRADARRLLMDLAQHNAFVQPATEYSAAYRFHRLFGELLRTQLRCEASERTEQLHRRAAAWFAAHGQTVEAVSHAVRARDFGAAARVAIDHHAIGGLVLGGTGGLGGLFQNLPDDLEDAEVAIVAAALALADGSADRCAKQLSRAQELVIRRGWAYNQALALADLVLSVLLAAAAGDHRQVLQMCVTTELALAQAPPDELARHPELRVLVLAAKGMAESRLGAVDAAIVSLTEATTIAAPGCEGLRIHCLQHLALIEAHRGRLGHADRLANETIDLADRFRPGPADRPIIAHLALAWVAMEQYDVDAAGRHLRAADPRRYPSDDGLVTAAFALVKSRRLQARGELRGALTVLEEAEAATGGTGPPEWLTREVTVTRARLMITTGQPQEALETVHRFPQPHPPDVLVLHAAALAAVGEPQRARETILPVVGAGGLDRPILVDAWLILATLAAQLGDSDEARAALRHALRFAAPEAQRRAVQHVWAQLRRVLRDDDELIEQYRGLQGAPANPAREAEHAHGPGDVLVVESLSKREMEVLQGMAGMLPTEEIAASLFVSVNTVKTHVRSILRKLSASRRNEAVRRARSVGLI
jgi:LuxR family maltose regulon positive regulatory protein